MSQVDASLYQDFSYCMSEWIKSGKAFYKSDDFLIAAREIFKGYFAECELTLPE